MRKRIKKQAQNLLGNLQKSDVKKLIGYLQNEIDQKKMDRRAYGKAKLIIMRSYANLYMSEAEMEKILLASGKDQKSIVDEITNIKRDAYQKALAGEPITLRKKYERRNNTANSN